MTRSMALMTTSELTPEAATRLAHVRNHLDDGFDVPELLSIIEQGTGNPAACVLELGYHAQAMAIWSWFSDRDLTSTRQWFYVAARLSQRYDIMEREHWGRGPWARFLGLLAPLLSNDDAMIDWYARHDDAYDLTRVEDHKTLDFSAYHGLLALRGEWDRLAARCQLLIDDPPGASAWSKFALDNEFFFALAKGDVMAMNSVLAKLCSARIRKGRSIYESGFTDGLISSFAVIYAKIAWRHGYSVSVASPYVPEAWLPMTPLSTYSAHYGFLGANEVRRPARRPFWLFSKGR